MCRKIVVIIVFIVLAAAESMAGLTFVGSLDSKKENFYYTGGDVLTWSGYGSKQYEDKFETIFKYNFEDKEEKAVYAGTCISGGLKLSPDNNYMGAFCPENNSVFIFDMDWKKIVEVKGSIYEFEWHPDSKKIVYVTGEKSIRKGPYGMALKPDGVWLYDIEEAKKEKLSVLGKHVKLNQKERMLNLWNGERWVKYDFDTAKVTETSMTLEDVDYSPDGKYYMDASGMNFAPPYWSPFRIYDSKSGAASPVEKIGFISERNPQKFIWGNDGKLLFNGRTTRTVPKKRLYIFDFNLKKIVRQFEGRIAGHSDDLAWLVIYRDGKFYLERFK